MLHLTFTKYNSNAIINLPASKSISNRALIINALTGNKCMITNLSTASDTIILQELLASPLMILNANDCGTAFRFITAYYATHATGRSRIITGAPHLRTRPIADLVNALQSIGCNICYMDKDGFAPIKITPTPITKNKIQIDGSKSSQFISALCLVAPCVPNGLAIEIIHSINSEPYINMTLQMMKQFGVDSTKTSNQILIKQSSYSAVNYTVENDWSSACFFYCALILLGQNTSLTIQNLSTTSIQGDKFIATVAIDFGITTIPKDANLIITNNGIKNIKANYHFSDFPDLAVPLIVVCALQFPTVTISGLQTLTLKECDRINALQTELAKVGVQLKYVNDILSFTGAFNNSKNVIFNVYNDHRIAMALSLICILNKNVSIDNESVVSKSFPTYWQELAKLAIT
jgi:3-phosphoshikimate 1-carboxyvinyltransferase